MLLARGVRSSDGVLICSVVEQGNLFGNNTLIAVANLEFGFIGDYLPLLPSLSFLLLAYFLFTHLNL